MASPEAGAVFAEVIDCSSPADFEAHDRPGRRSPCTFLESGGEVCGRQTVPDERSGNVVRLRLDGICFDDFSALLLDVRNRGTQKLHAQSLPPLIFADEQTRDRPHRRVIDRLQNAGSLQGWVVFTRSHGTPADGFALQIADDSRRRPRLDELEHYPLVAGTLVFLESGPRLPPKGTPAPAASAALAEERFKIVPALGGQGAAFKTGHLKVRYRAEASFVSQPRAKAAAAQPLAVDEINWSFPYGKPPS
jgi:hypothetical protein